MAFEVTRQEILKQAIELKRLYDTTRIQKYKDEELRLRRIVVELDGFTSGGGGGVTQIVAGTNVTVSPTGGTGAVTINATTPNLQQVTDVGNTTTNSIETNGVTSDYFLLDTTATPTPQTGMMFWDQDTQTPDIQLDSQLAGRVFQDEFWYVKNQTGSQINKGTVVRAVGTLGASSRILVAPMVADGSVPAKFILGIAAENIPDGADGSVMRAGKIRQIDTSMFSAGDILYANPATPGGLIATLPQAPNLKLAVAFVVHAATNGVLAVRVEVGSDLYEDHRVQVSSPTDGQLLRYDGTDQRWENWTPNFLTTVPTLDQVTTAGNTTTNSIGIGLTTTPTYKLDVFGTGVNGGVSSNVGFNIQPVDPPNITGMTYTLLSGTALSVGTYWYHVIYYNAIGETSRSNPFQVITTTGNQVVQLNNIPISSNPSVIGRNIYRGKVGDSASYGVKVGTIANNTSTTFTDSVPDTDPIFPSSVLDYPIFGKANTTSQYISVFGVRSMIVDAAGLTTFGYQAGLSITSAGQTTLFGWRAGQNITTRGGNTLFGFSAGSTITSGAQNVGIGDNVLVGVTTGSYNVGLGPNVLQTNGSFNIAMGYFTGRQTTGDRNVLIGSYIGNSALTMSDSIIIGHNATPLAGTNNQINIGNTIYGRRNTGNVMIGTTTDAGYKLDVNGTTRLNGDSYIQNGFLVVNGTAAAYSGNALTVYRTNKTVGAIFQDDALTTTVTGSYDNPVVMFNNINTTTNNWTKVYFGSSRSDTASVQAAIGVQNILHGSSGTNGKGDIAFFTRNTTTFSEKLRITHEGNVGIGTTSPTAPLDVRGRVYVEHNNDNFVHGVTVRQNNTTSSSLAGFQIMYGSSAVAEFNYRASNFANPALANTVVFNSVADQKLAFIANTGVVGNGQDVYFKTRGNNQNGIIIFGITNNVGINTATDAGFGLDVNGTARIQGNINAQSYTVNGVAGWTGTITIPTNPPGQQNISVTSGIIVNVF
jgi:hypothetical protein